MRSYALMRLSWFATENQMSCCWLFFLAEAEKAPLTPEPSRPFAIFTGVAAVHSFVNSTRFVFFNCLRLVVVWRTLAHRVRVQCWDNNWVIDESEMVGRESEWILLFLTSEQHFKDALFNSWNARVRERLQCLHRKFLGPVSRRHPICIIRRTHTEAGRKSCEIASSTTTTAQFIKSSVGIK